MTSMGYVMMNWTSELIKQTKKRKRKEMKISRKLDGKGPGANSDAVPGLPSSCLKCPTHLEHIQSLEHQMGHLREQQQEVMSKLDGSKLALATSMDRETKYREENERLVLEEAQARYELTELGKKLQEEVCLREEDHEQQLQLMEQVLRDKEHDWAVAHEALQADLGNALRTSAENSNIESMSRAQLEQELNSLQLVMDMRSKELQQMRQANQELSQKMERHHWLESELNKARQRLEEMNLVVQNKMVAEKEMLDLTEGLTNDLAKARNEILQLRRDLENQRYLHGDVEESPSDPRGGQRNQHQKLWW